MKKGKLNVSSCYIISAMQGFVELSIVNIVNKLLRFWGFQITVNDLTISTLDGGETSDVHLRTRWATRGGQQQQQQQQQF